MRDTELMARALTLADGARRRTPPNPWVGCVLAADGVVVGEGATHPPGGPHAEAEAVAAAGARAAGATAYVTLEPCAHQGRTGPCVDALLRAGVSRVVVALEDPDPHVAGRGLAALRASGVTVDVGVGTDAAARSLAPYLHQRRTGRTFCVAKTAGSVDGRTAAPDGTSQWITGPAARADAHGLRADSQAIVVGAGTALTDQPTLTVRDAAAPPAPPLRVLLDARGRVPAVGPLFDADLAPTLVVTTAAAPNDVTDDWRAHGAKVEVVGASRTGVDLDETLTLLARHGVLQALVEGGAGLHGALWRARLVDRLVVYVGATLLGSEARGLLDAAGPTTIGDARRWTLHDVRVLDDDVRLTYEPERA
ncbi:MAG TPA: bifunctional diaminohydroxyphosphoribosylaminopyrimidine deaminase/5-amino-6-(5-phosphoribosylamino)uracil reductase RibD [Acidimicrobiia bacterium]|nr:bifunctional diaminohydroxyphosphoribosylaminopyrimidine deaminase/5-amino-6-(5-phosphoribosylamino)uracil reductase RibD [Acidimicrobiia bacterium]